VQEGLAKLQKSRDELLQKRGKATGDQDQLPELEKELAELKANPIEPPKQGEIERLQAALDANRPMLTDLQKQVESLGPGKAPKFYPGVCPAFPGSEIPCPKARVVAIPGHKAADPAKIEKVQGYLKNQKEKVESLEKDLQQAQAHQTSFDEYPIKLRDLAANIARIKAQAGMVAELDQEIAGLDARMKTGQELLVAVRTFWQQKDAFDEAAAKSAKAEKETVGKSFAVKRRAWRWRIHHGYRQYWCCQEFRKIFLAAGSSQSGRRRALQGQEGRS